MTTERNSMGKSLEDECGYEVRNLTFSKDGSYTLQVNDKKGNYIFLDVRTERSPIRYEDED